MKAKTILAGLAALALGAGCNTLDRAVVRAAEGAGWGNLQLIAHHENLPGCFDTFGNYYRHAVKINGIDEWNEGREVEGIFCCRTWQGRRDRLYDCKLLEYHFLY